MNKVNLSPFVIPSSQNTQISPTPRLLSKSRKTNSHVNKLRCSKRDSFENEQTFHFDDTFCFRDCNHKSIEGRKTCKSEGRPGNKCNSQILTVKMMDGVIGEKASCNTFRTGHRTVDTHQFDTVLPLTFEGNSNRRRKNYTSQSTRKKQYFQVNCDKDPLIAGLIKDVKQVTMRKSSLIPNSQCFSEPYTPERQQNKMIVPQFETVSRMPKNSLSGTTFKQNNFLQYSIIKPNEIKSLGLNKRVTSNEKKKKDQRAIYHELLLQVKSKKQMVKQSQKKKQEKEASYRARQVGRRVGVHSSAAHRQTFNTIEQDESVEPWTVQNNNDIQ